MENIPWLGDRAERLSVGTFEIARARHLSSGPQHTFYPFIYRRLLRLRVYVLKVDVSTGSCSDFQLCLYWFDALSDPLRWAVSI